MTILEQIKIDSLSYRKAKDALGANLLTTLYAEALAVGKNDGNRETTDEETVRTIKKFLKGVEQTLQLIGDSEQLQREQAILTHYLPSQLSEDELRKIIKEMAIMKPDVSMGQAMQSLKSSYAGLYDGAIASKLVKQILNE